MQWPRMTQAPKKHLRVRASFAAEDDLDGELDGEECAELGLLVRDFLLLLASDPEPLTAAAPLAAGDADP
jgi:hypothetical protein